MLHAIAVLGLFLEKQPENSQTVCPSATDMEAISVFAPTEIRMQKT